MGASTVFPALLGGLFALLAWSLGAPAALAVGAAALLAVSVLARPLRGLLIFCLLAPALPWMTVTLGVRITTSEAVLALTWIGVALQWSLGRLTWPQGGRTERAMRWLVVWTVVPLVAGQFLTVAAEGIGPVNWVRWVLNVSPVFLVPWLVRDEGDRRRVMLCLLLGFGLLVAISLGFFLVGRDARLMIPFLTALQYGRPEAIEVIFSSDYGRMASPWVHPNSTGGALLLAAPLGLFTAVVSRGGMRALGLWVFLGSVAGIVFSGSRGALLSLGVLVMWLVAKRTPYAGRGLFLAVLMAVVLVFLYPPALQRFTSLVSSNDASTGVRFEEYAHFLENVRRYPLGLGFKAELPATGAGIYGISNLWLGYWFKLGLPGMLLFLAVTLAWWREVRMVGPFLRITPANALRIGTVGTVLAALATGFVDHYFGFTQVLITLFWLILSLSLLEARSAAPTPSPTASPVDSARKPRP